MTFRFLAPAQAELFEAITYYSEINAELGVRFEQAVANSVRAAATHPERGAPRSRNTRRWLVKGFPFGVIDREGEHEILVVALAHQRKQPEYWERRL
jgi:plasmid stabilization system protein ParE